MAEATVVTAVYPSPATGTFRSAPSVTEIDLTSSPETTGGSAAERAHVLRSLYDDLHELNRKKRLSGLTAHESAYLDEVRVDIDRWEKKEALQSDPELWRRIDELAVRILGLHQK